MEWLSEDPRYLAGGLGVLAAVLLVALRVTQQGKYLLWALGTLALAGLVVVVEWLWVTDNERIERTVHGLATAVAASDVPATLDHLTPDVRFTGSMTTRIVGPSSRDDLADWLVNARFDFLRLTHLQVNAGGQSRRGTAEFRVLAGGSIQRGGFTYNFGSTNSSWSLGLIERNGAWKVNRITPVQLPAGAERALPR